MIYQEEFNIELKELISSTFLKTVSAYANYNDGKIIFGIADDGAIVGISSVKETLLQIENMVNDTIEPRPKYRLMSEKINGKSIIILEVNKGMDTPYYYKGNAYKRSDTATTPVDRHELKRLVLQGMNFDYEETKANIQELKFNYFEKKLKEIVGITKLSSDILKTLDLYSLDGYYNVAAELFSDNNSFGSLGIDMIKFGKDVNEIQDRDVFMNMSILEQFDLAIKVFERYYQTEIISGYTRKEKQRIPKEAFREALANAIVHRQWDVHAHIQIAMYDDRLEINSPGGLPFGISEEAYLQEQISVLRNPIIASIFHRLKIIEKFGTGVGRIINEYNASVIKPQFVVNDYNIRIILPVYQSDLPKLSSNESTVYNLISENMEVSRFEIDEEVGFNKSKTLRVLDKLLEKGLIDKKGSSASTTYTIKK